MDKISTFLADYCIRHSQVPREKREIYINISKREKLTFLRKNGMMIN